MKKNEQTKQATTQKVEKKPIKQVGPKQTQQSTSTKKIVRKEVSNTIDHKEVVKLFKSGKTVYQIAKKLGKYYSQIAPILESEGLSWTKRPAGPTNKRNYSIYCSPEQYKQVKELLKNNK